MNWISPAIIWSAEGTVADDGDDLPLLALQARGNRHAEGSADGCAGMADAEGVVVAFAALGEARQATGLAHGMHLLHTAGENLVGVALVSHVPDDAVVGRVEHVVQGNGELHHAQARAEERRAMAMAREQEMRAQVVEMQARVVEAEAEVPKAMAQAFLRLKLVAEPGGAVALAAALFCKNDISGDAVIVTISGGNVDPALFVTALDTLR